MTQRIIRLVPENKAWDVRNPPPAEWISKTPTDWQLWGKEHGTVDFAYLIGGRDAKIGIFKRYDPLQMPTIAHILGAIYYFYNTPMTKEDAKEVFDNSLPGTAGFNLTQAFLQNRGSAPRHIDVIDDPILVTGLEYDEDALGIYSVV